MPTAVDIDDIQGLLVAGYGHLKAACFVLLEIRDRRAAGAWLGSVAGEVTSGKERPEARALNLALTPSGLEKLGLKGDYLLTFSDEFVSGMTTPHRSRILGDTDENAPEHWRWGGSANPPIDVLLLLYAADEAQLETIYNARAAAFGQSGLRQIEKLQTALLDVKEPFGFNDGVSQPVIEGLPRTGTPSNTIKAGEMILGYPNEYELYTDRPRIPRADDPRGILPADTGGSGNHDLGRNGTYLVMRQLEQDVHGFWQHLDRATANGDGAGDPAARVKLAAKMVGRWPSGAPLVLAPNRDDPSLGTANDFGYGHADPYGFGCPVGAHIRRANPRDSLDPDPGSAGSIALNKRHRILRRGRAYGSQLTPEEALASSGSGEDEHGLYFICLNANIARQFEFIQHTWVNNPKFDGLYDDVDPLMGPRGDAGASHTTQGVPVRERVSGLPRFVTTRGGAYFFLPGIRAIRYLATLG